MIHKIRQSWNKHFLGLQLFLSVLAGILFLSSAILFNGSAVVNSVLNGNRSAIYSTLASVFGSLLGFVITALSIIIGYSTNEKFEFLRKSVHYSTLWQVLISTIKALSFATVVMLLGLVLDRDNPSKILIVNSNIIYILLLTIHFLSIIAIVLSIFRLGSCIWVLENVVKLIIGI